MIWWMVLTMTMPPPTCTPLQGDHIIAADLARAAPEFATAPPDAEIAYAPAPGMRRVFHIDELRRVASRLNVTLARDREVCFTWELARLNPENVIAAMRQALGLQDARIQVLEMSHVNAPAGQVVFPITRLLPPADRRGRQTIWRGYVLYGGSRRFDVWAKVKISAPTPRVVASRYISARRAITPADVTVETSDDFPIWKGVARALDEVVGRVSTRSIEKGRAVMESELIVPPVVNAGDVVQVDVQFGRAHLKMDAVAENSGRPGEIIRMRNPRSGKNFRAQVQATGKVLVMPNVTGGVVD